MWAQLSNTNRLFTPFFSRINKNSFGCVVINVYTINNDALSFLFLQHRLVSVCCIVPCCTAMPNVAIQCNMFCTHYWLYNTLSATWLNCRPVKIGTISLLSTFLPSYFFYFWFSCSLWIRSYQCCQISEYLKPPPSVASCSITWYLFERSMCVFR